MQTKAPTFVAAEVDQAQPSGRRRVRVDVRKDPRQTLALKIPIKLGEELSAPQPVAHVKLGVAPNYNGLSHSQNQQQTRQRPRDPSPRAATDQKALDAAVRRKVLEAARRPERWSGLA